MRYLIGLALLALASLLPRPAFAIEQVCNAVATAHITTNTDTKLVAGVVGQKIYVCDIEFSFNGTGNIFLETSASTSCTTPTQIAQAWYGIANLSKAHTMPFYNGLVVASGLTLCVNTSAAVTQDVTVYYDQY